MAERRPVNTVQDALHRFAGFIASRTIFDEASIALDSGRDYKLTLTVVEKDNGYLVAMDRHQVERTGHSSFIKLGHGEWGGAPVDVPESLTTAAPVKTCSCRREAGEACNSCGGALWATTK